MRAQLTLILLLSLFIVTPAFAGPGHDHAHDPITSAQASSLAESHVKQLAEAGKIDSSWSGKPAASVEQKTFSKGPEWVVVFKNDQVTDASKQTLYLFYTLDGRYLAANYTGN